MLTDKQRDIISCLAFNRMNVSFVARAMHYHRNTIVHHIKKIKEITGLDPLDFFDLQELYKMAGGEQYADEETTVST